MAVTRMGESDNDLGAWRAKRRDLSRRKVKMDELNRGGLSVFPGALLIRLGAGENALAADGDEGRILDAAERRRARPRAAAGRRSRS